MPVPMPGLDPATLFVCPRSGSDWPQQIWQPAHTRTSVSQSRWGAGEKEQKKKI